MKKLAASLALAAAVAVSSFAADPELPRKAPELAFNVPGQGQKLLSQARGKVVALEFILTTCPHCQAASKLMTQLQQQYGARGFQALDIAINALDENRTPAQGDSLVQTFASNFQVGFPVGWVPRDTFNAFTGFSVMQRTVVPQLILIDRKGVIRYQTPATGDENSMKEQTIRTRLEELLSEGATASNHPAAKSHSARKAS